MTTLLLDMQTGDLALDAKRSIALASDPYATAQNVATACKLIKGESLYNAGAGVEYSKILGEKPNAAFVNAQLSAAAKTVPGVNSARVINSGLTKERVLVGTIEFTTNGGAQIVNF